MSLEPTDPLATLTHERLTPLIGEVFHWQPEGATAVAFTLAEVKPLGGARPGQRAPFSLLFRPADPHFHAPQQIFELEHPQLGALAIFLVPIRPDATGARLEAVFT
jgi:hypothetical protein